MSYLEDLLQVLLTRGGELWPEGGSLRVRAAQGILSPWDLQTLRENKAEVLRLLPDFTFTLPLSYGQQALWLVQENDRASAAYNIGLALHVEGAIDASALHGALQRLLNRHTILRTTVSSAGSTPAQLVRGYQNVSLEEVNATTRTWPEVMEMVSGAHNRPFDLGKGPVFRATRFTRSPREDVLLLGIHHIACDGWCFPMLLDELLVLYEALAAGSGADPLRPIKRTYQQFVQWQRNTLASSGEQLSAYWLQALQGAPQVLDLAEGRPRPALQTYNGAAIGFTIEPGLTERLKSIAKSGNTTLYTVLLAAFQVFLHRYTGQAEILVGSPAAGRDSEEFRETAGYMVNPVVVRATFSTANSPAFTTFLKQTRGRVLKTLEHQDYPFPLLVQDLLSERDPSRSPIFQVMFVYQRWQGLSQRVVRLLEGGPIEAAGLRLSTIELPQTTSEFDLTLELEERPATLKGSFRYNTDLFRVPAIERMVAQFQKLLEGIAIDPRRRVAELPLLTEAERSQIVVEWNRTAIPYVSSGLHQMFEKQSELTPDSIALSCGDQSLTYAELNRRSNRLAHYLLSLGVHREARVGICLERSIDMIVGLLGVLKAGGAYVALDPAYPLARLAFALEDAGASLLLANRDLAGTLPSVRTLVCLDEQRERIAREAETNPGVDVIPAELAYVLYTSGSTGRPKGVAIEHRNAVAMVAWAVQEFPREVLAGTLASTSICFDLSVFEIFVPLSCGGCVMLAENALALPELPAKRRVTLVNTVPSAMKELLKMGPLPAGVQIVNLAGEALPHALVQELYRQPAVRKVYNLYGPSEDTTYSTFCVVERTVPGDPPIGKPISNSQAYILDCAMQPVPPGVTGELFLAGDGLARGYINRPGLTAERFLPNPFGRGRLYKTGDLARYSSDGQIQFLGRTDRQIKLRGFRINLGEIETVLTQHPGVEEAVVGTTADAGGGQHMVAYWIGRQADAPSDEELRAHLGHSLPSYMLPSFFVRLQAFPLTPNGKLDRRALPPPDVGTVERRHFEPPRTPTETELAGIWRDVLGLDQVGIHENFFHLGGHSLLAFQVIARMRPVFQLELPLRCLMETPVLQDLATYVDTIRSAQRIQFASHAASLSAHETGRV
ncbi:MAG TPA: amino acid adenylation domain-containing protein [Bryobacteraceae bacterium]|nr:amino acid adenylation domain-containing protein [Bryobacteraceae bacterium]